MILNWWQALNFSYVQTSASLGILTLEMDLFLKYFLQELKCTAW